MESTPSSGSPAPAPPTRRAIAALDRSWLRSRRAKTFGLGALCGALGVALVIVVASIFAASAARSPLLPEQPVSEVRTTPQPTPTPTSGGPTPTPTPTPTPQEDSATPPDSRGTVEPQVPPAPAPAPTQTAEPPADEEPVRPGNSGSAPGHTKAPKP